jgi:hypothetical protein
MDQPDARPLPAQNNTENKSKQIFIPRMGFEPTIPVLEGTKTFHALDRAATAIGRTVFVVSGN